MTTPPTPQPPRFALVARLRALWRGDLPLSEAFWTWAALGGVAVTVTTTVLMLALLALDRPITALFVGYGVAVPYNFVAGVGVWRSAARYTGPEIHADLARGASVMLLLVLSLV